MEIDNKKFDDLIQEEIDRITAKRKETTSKIHQVKRKKKWETIMPQNEDVKIPNDGPLSEPMEQPPDRIRRISMEYHSKISAKAPAGTIGIDYRERFVMDRQEEKLELVKTVGSGSQITHTFYLPYAISNLLDELDSEQWQKPLPDAPDDFVEPSDSSKDFPRFYHMTITFQRHPGPGIFRLL